MPQQEKDAMLEVGILDICKNKKTNMNNKNDTKDKLSWDKIHQLHEAVSNFSKQSFDIKKLWITVEVSAITLMMSLKVKDFKFIVMVSFAVLIFFYLLDSMTYYYQDKLREGIAKEQNAIRKRNSIIEEKVERTNWRFFRSLVNWSHLLYYFVITILIVTYILC